MILHPVKDKFQNQKKNHFRYDSISPCKDNKSKQRISNNPYKQQQQSIS